MASFTPGVVFQQAFVVADLDQAIDAFSRDLNIGGWLRLKDAKPWTVTYRGAPITVPLSVALGYGGEMMYELIQQHDDQPSIYTDGVRRSGYGFHHWGIVAGDYEARVARYRASPDYEEVSSLGDSSMGRAVYFDGHPAIPGLLELIEPTAAFTAFADMIYGLRRDLGPDGPYQKRL